MCWCVCLRVSMYVWMCVHVHACVHALCLPSREGPYGLARRSGACGSFIRRTSSQSKGVEGACTWPALWHLETPCARVACILCLPFGAWEHHLRLWPASRACSGPCGPLYLNRPSSILLHTWAKLVVLLHHALSSVQHMHAPPLATCIPLCLCLMRRQMRMRQRRPPGSRLRPCHKQQLQQQRQTRRS